MGTELGCGRRRARRWRAGAWRARTAELAQRRTSGPRPAGAIGARTGAGSMGGRGRRGPFHRQAPLLPAGEAVAHVADILVALPGQEAGGDGRARAALAVDDERTIAWHVLEARRQLGQRYQQRARDVSRAVLL